MPHEQGMSTALGTSLEPCRTDDASRSLGLSQPRHERAPRNQWLKCLRKLVARAQDMRAAAVSGYPAAAKFAAAAF
jgi:hypothetical protein